MALFKRNGFIAALILAVTAIYLALLFDPEVTEIILLLVLPTVSCVVITGMKGKYGLLATGVLFHLCWAFGAIRLAKPNSYWARRFYGSEKMNLAQIRFAPAIYMVTGLSTDGRQHQGP